MAVSSTAVSTLRQYCWASCKIIVDHDDDYGDSDGDADDSDCLLHGRVHLERIFELRVKSMLGMRMVRMVGMVGMIKQDHLESLQKEPWSFNLVPLKLHVKAKWRLLGFHYFAISLLLIFRDVINYLSKTLPGLKDRYLWGWRQSPIRKQFALGCPRSFDCSQRSSGSPLASWRRNHKTQETSHDNVRGDAGYGG